MITNQDFDEFFRRFFDKFDKQDDISISQWLNPVTGRSVDDYRGVEMCQRGIHDLKEIGEKRDIVDWTNKHGTPIRGFRTWAVNKCQRCGTIEHLIKI